MGEVQDGGETEEILREEFNTYTSPPPVHWIIYDEPMRLLCLNVSKQHIFCNNILKLHVVF